MHHRTRIGAAVVALLAISVTFPAAAGQNAPHRVAGEKLDSGLGKLPHYRDWAKYPALRPLVRVADGQRIAGEKLDSGLGSLPHYREWGQHTSRVSFRP